MTQGSDVPPPVFQPDAPLRAALNAAQHPLLILDARDGRVLAANPASRRFFGRSVDELRGMALSSLCAHPDRVDAALRDRRDILPLSYQLHVTGKHVPAELAFSHTVGAGREICFVAVRDLSAAMADDLAQHNAERFYRGIFGAAPYPILIVDARQTLADANAAALALYGLAPEDLDGKLKLHQFLVDGAMAHRYFQTGAYRIGAHRQRRRDGAEFIAEASVAQTRRDRASRWVVVVRDMTDEQNALAALHASEERWRFALEGHGNGVWEWNPDTGEFYVSRRFCEILEFDGGAPVTFADWEARLHPEDIPVAHKAIMSHLTLESPLIELEVRLRDGAERYRWLELRAMAMGRDEHGRTRRVVGTARVIDAERARRQREQDEARRMLHMERLASMGEVATLIAHEINQPLTAIGNFAGAALRQFEREPEQARRALELIQFAARNAGAIIQRVRGFAQNPPRPTATLDLNATIVETIRFVEHEARAASARIKLELDKDLPPIGGDKVQLGQLVLNLVKNGIEAMKEQPLPRTVTVRTRLAGANGVRLEVDDAGCGLPVELCDELFQPFFTTKSDGVGIGLSICRTIVENHGGAIATEALPERGTRFAVDLPTR